MKFQVAYDAIRFGAEENTTDAAEFNGTLQHERACLDPDPATSGRK